MATALLVAAPASAHVTVDTPDAGPGGFGKVVFRVPTESDTASTTKVTIDLPKDTPFAFVSSRAKPGWKVSMKKIKHDEPVKAGGFEVTETVSQVTWTAQKGNGIEPGQFDEFALSVGPFPDEPGAEIVFAATQAYSDGSTVAWDEPTPKSGEEPEHPAPTLTLDADGPDASAATESSQGSEGTSTMSVVALSLSIVAIVFAVVGYVLAVRVRRPSA